MPAQPCGCWVAGAPTVRLYAAEGAGKDCVDRDTACPCGARRLPELLGLLQLGGSAVLPGMGGQRNAARTPLPPPLHDEIALSLLIFTPCCRGLDRRRCALGGSRGFAPRLARIR
jgi:hypothetical protein